jgi:CubicO group peptidase (beta-lactamase class C family)
VNADAVKEGNAMHIAGKSRWLAAITAMVMPAVTIAQPAPTAAELGLMMGSPPAPDKIVTAANFMSPPYNRWGLQHLRELVPTRSVPPAGPAAELPQQPVDVSNLPVTFRDGGTTTVGDWLAHAFTDGFIVLHHGNVVFERYYNGQTPATQHLMYSVTKSLTGTMMLMLMEQGLVDGAARVDTYLPELGDTAFGDATVQQMLDMTNSIEYNEEYYNPDADITRYLASLMPGGEGLEANLRGLKTHDRKFAHGEAFHYVTPNPEVLGWIIRRVTGENLATALHRMIWSKLGAEQEAYYWLDPYGVEMAGGGLSMSLRDAARFGQMILADGHFNGQQIVSAAIAQRIKTPRNAELFSLFYDDPWYGEFGGSYHDQWWGYKDSNVVAALGIHGQFIYINPDADVVIAKHSSDPEAESERVDVESVLVMNAILEHLQQLQPAQ